ncbi:MAG: acyl-ACP--UDP-N-acetylglucosamine O-acyltransferase [Candidatus Binatia bacterium]
MNDRVHRTAIVGQGAVLGSGTRVGPYTVIGSDVVIGEDCVIGPHVVVDGLTTIGDRNRVFQFASVGGDPQDLKYDGEATRLEIGDDNTVREFATLNRGTADGGGVTRVGDSNLFMAYSHVAHDCRVGNSVVMANGATLAGHVTVEDCAIVGGLVAIHQFVRIGSSAILGGGSMVSLDVPPYCMAAGDRAKLHGLNVVGLKRRGFSDGVLRDLRRAYFILFQESRKLSDALAILREDFAGSEQVSHLVRFIEDSERGICRQ